MLRYQMKATHVGWYVHDTETGWLELCVNHADAEAKCANMNSSMGNAPTKGKPGPDNPMTKSNMQVYQEPY